MQSLFKAVLYLHISAGSLALILFWIPAFTKKGGNVHRKVGMAYVWLMWLVVVSAMLLSIKNLVVGNTISGAFLGFISLITANPLWFGIGVLKHKQSLSDTFVKRHLMFRALVVTAGLGLIVYGILIYEQPTAILLFIFGGLGLADLPNLIRETRKPISNRSWFKEHFVGMFTSGIAAFTAFLVFGANNYLSGVLSGAWAVIPWIAPTIVGTIAIIYTVKHYQKQGMISPK